ALPGRAIDAVTGRHVQICRPDALSVDLPPRFTDLDPARPPQRFPVLPGKDVAAAMGRRAALWDH
ncbi:hypothetical protein, partial [Streptomyces hirsutus]|uniref:hypothetical protein n=1 Tax=Streptomyces hirsutus TaxID=35620 RepID=UPI00198166CC